MTTLAANVALSGAEAKITTALARQRPAQPGERDPGRRPRPRRRPGADRRAATNQGQVWIGADSTLSRGERRLHPGRRADDARPTPRRPWPRRGTGAEVRLTGGFLAAAARSHRRSPTRAVICGPTARRRYGTLSVAGPYTQGPSGQLLIDIAGTAAGSYDRLAVSGKATLGGQLVVTRARSYAPIAGDSFAVVTAGSRSGTFAK